jgi:hypothetical protein
MNMERPMQTFEEKADQLSATLALKALQILQAPEFGNGAQIDSFGFWSTFGNAWVARNGTYVTLDVLQRIVERRAQALGVDVAMIYEHIQVACGSPEADQAFKGLSFDEKFQRFRVPAISNDPV